VRLTNDLIDELLRCQKKIIELPGRWKLDRGYNRTSFELQSLDEKFFFKAFGRVNTAFNENFSFGLIFFPQHEKGSYEIIRCNGPHGEHKSFPHHNYYHIHIATQQNVDMGLKEDSSIEITHEYTNFEQAYRYFAGRINIIPADMNLLFPPIQTTLFD
jgi:hypothetical protein